MNLSEYSKKFNSYDEALEQLHSEIYNAFMQNIEKIFVTKNAEGHQTMLFNGNALKIDDLSFYIQKIVNDIDYQHVVNQSILESSVSNIKTPYLDIDQLLLGNLQWEYNISFKPDSSLLTCLNDGEKYILEMKNWNMDFYNFIDFVRKKEKVYIKPFEYDKSLVHSTIDFPSGNLIVFNSLPREITDYIESNFTQSRYLLHGREWDKFIGEILLSVNILRAPSSLGCSVFRDTDNIVIGNMENTSSAYSNLYIGDTEHDVLQTLVADKTSLKNLISVALNKNEKQTQDYIDDIIFTQIATGFKVAPGTYNAYYYPNVEADIKREPLYGDFLERHKFSNLVNPDMVITQETIQPLFKLDTITIVPEEEKSYLKDKLNVKKVIKNDLSI